MLKRRVSGPVWLLSCVLVAVAALAAGGRVVGERAAQFADVQAAGRGAVPVPRSWCGSTASTRTPATAEL
jgi:hypothetical protein